MQFDLFEDQPNEVISIYLKYTKYNQKFRLINPRTCAIYDNLAPRKYKMGILKWTRFEARSGSSWQEYSQGDIQKLPYKWSYSAGFIPEDEEWGNTRKLTINRRLGNKEMEKIIQALLVGEKLNILDISHGYLDLEDVNSLSYALKTNESLTSLDLSRTNEMMIFSSFSDNGVSLLADALKYIRGLVDLNLEGNGIRIIGAKSLAEALKINQSLASLNLGSNSIEGEGVIALARSLENNTNLTYLNIGSNGLGGGINSLSEALKINRYLRTLILDHNSIGDNEIRTLFEALKLNSSITSLNLEGNNIRYFGACTLSESLDNLKILNLKDNMSIGSVGITCLAKAIRSNSTLSSLDISNTNATKGVNFIALSLKDNISLTYLNLKYNRIDADGIRLLSDALKTNNILLTLGLANNEIDINGVNILAEALKFNSTLETLDIGWCKVDIEGARAIAEALKSNSSLKTLILNYNSIGREGSEFIFEAIRINPSLVNLYLDRNRNDYYESDIDIIIISSVLSTNTSLTTLSLIDNNIEDEGARLLSEALVDNTHLTSLDLRNNYIRDDGISYLANSFHTNKTLLSLGISDNAFSAKSLDIITSMPILLLNGDTSYEIELKY